MWLFKVTVDAAESVMAFAMQAEPQSDVQATENLLRTSNTPFDQPVPCNTLPV